MIKGKKIKRSKLFLMKLLFSLSFFLLFNCKSIDIFGQTQQDSITVSTVFINDSITIPKFEDSTTDSLSLTTDTLKTDSTKNYIYRNIKPPITEFDSTKVRNYWNITERTGEIITAHPDTFLTDYFNRTNVEGFGISEAYLGNLGSPTQSRMFFDRNDRSLFMFQDGFYRYSRTPGKFNFMNTKIPHSNISYQTAGSRQLKEERLQGLLAINIGKKINIGFDVDYLYSRGHYESQGAKRLEWVFFGNYLSDRHLLHIFINPSESTNAENGGIENSQYITYPDQISNFTGNSRDIPTKLKDTWNKLKGGRYYLNYHFNLGFERDTEYTDEEGTILKQFIPVSSIIYTFDYKNNKKRFYSTNENAVNEYYKDKKVYLNKDLAVNDSTSYWSLSNTIGLSLREGFSEWSKFDLTAFLTQDFRSFSLMDSTLINYESNQNATYIGGEIAKRKGNIFRYNAQASFGVLGYNLADLNLTGNIETRIPLWGDTASVKAFASIKNLAPTFYENHYRSKYFWWENDFSKVKKVLIGGQINIPHTNTVLGIGVENLTKYIYFDKDGLPRQHDSNIQVLAAQLEQNFSFKALHWDNRLVYQTSSDQNILPLPDFTAYSSLYIQFKIAKVLTIQMGGNIHYFTKYYSPTYEPATQQFKLQDYSNATKVGNYPLISGFINCHLKQTRFFIEYYNASALFVSPPEYFSMPLYPVNPNILKLGLSVDFIN